MKTELLGGKIEFLGGEKETQGVGREIFVGLCNYYTQSIV
jgi:hypothetical protein